MLKYTVHIQLIRPCPPFLPPIPIFSTILLSYYQPTLPPTFHVCVLCNPRQRVGSKQTEGQKAHTQEHVNIQLQRRTDKDNEEKAKTQERSDLVTESRGRRTATHTGTDTKDQMERDREA